MTELDKIMDILGKAVNRELLLEIDDKMVEYKTMLATYSVAQGLKVAIEIIDGSYCSRSCSRVWSRPR